MSEALAPEQALQVHLMPRLKHLPSMPVFCSTQMNNEQKTNEQTTNK
jgi:hypothetical protein